MPAVKKTRKVFKYYIYMPMFNEGPEDAEGFNSSFSEPSLIGSQYIEYLYNERDGWLWMAPNTNYEVVIIFPSGKFENVYVSYEMEPIFYAEKKNLKTKSC